MGYPGLEAENLVRFLHLGLGNNHSLPLHMLELFRAWKWTQKWRDTEREKKDSLMYVEVSSGWNLVLNIMNEIELFFLCFQRSLCYTTHTLFVTCTWQEWHLEVFLHFHTIQKEDKPWGSAVNLILCLTGKNPSRAWGVGSPLCTCACS